MGNNNPENLSDKEQEKVGGGTDMTEGQQDIIIAELEKMIEEKTGEYHCTNINDPGRAVLREELFKLNNDLIYANYCKHQTIITE